MSRLCSKCGEGRPTEFHVGARICKPCARAKTAAWRAANRSRHQAYSRNYHWAHRDEIVAKKVADYATNPAPTRSSQRAWRAANPDRVRELKRADYEKNREDYMRRARERRARKALAIGTHTEAEFRALVAAYGGRCAYCGASGKMTRDHKTPLYRGGSDDISNILPACAPCNARKGTRTREEFVA